MTTFFNDHPHKYSRADAQANPARKCYLVDFTTFFLRWKKIAHLKLKERCTIRKPISKFKADTFDHYKSFRCSSTQNFQFAIFSIDIHQSKFDIVHDIPILYLINIAQVTDDGELLVDDVIQYTFTYLVYVCRYLHTYLG